ncbi:MAG: site-specific DNA-methyltransferase [Chloroflexi bacterium]|nr:site-specific DNA-methyltransferase [Chloroflexota bacterium]
MATGISKTKWNGNLNRQWDNGDGFEVELSYKGKKTEPEILQSEPANIKLLWQGKDGWRNRLYYGDNLPLLAFLLKDAEIKKNVRLVYIDPPFSTRSVFQSRNQVDAYEDLLAGANYIEFLRERLILLRELLSDDGSIYVHLDDNMVFHTKVIMDEIFGKNNFRNWITRKKSNPKNYTRKAYGNISDYILFYTKTNNYVWNRPMENWTMEKADKEYTYIEENTGRRYKKVPIHAPGIRHGETGQPWRGMNPPPGKHWQFTPKTLDELDAKGEIYWSPTGNPRRKIYFDQSEGVQLQDIWLEFKDAHNQMVKISGYPTEKNPALVERIIKTSSNPGDLVLDCFCGSGTTLAVASELKRTWVGIDNSQEAIATTLKRFHKGLERMGDFVKKEDEPRQGKLMEVHEPITDFSLYASAKDEGDIHQIMEIISRDFGRLK